MVERPFEWQHGGGPGEEEWILGDRFEVSRCGFANLIALSNMFCSFTSYFLKDCGFL